MIGAEPGFADLPRRRARRSSPHRAAGRRRRAGRLLAPVARRPQPRPRPDRRPRIVLVAGLLDRRRRATTARRGRRADVRRPVRRQSSIPQGCSRARVARSRGSRRRAVRPRPRPVAPYGSPRTAGASSRRCWWHRPRKRRSCGSSEARGGRGPWARRATATRTGAERSPGSGRGYELTLIEAEALEALAADGVEITWEEARRNVVTRGIGLNALVGRRFRIGEVECVGRRLAEPCSHLQRLAPAGRLARTRAPRRAARGHRSRAARSGSAIRSFDRRRGHADGSPDVSASREADTSARSPVAAVGLEPVRRPAVELEPLEPCRQPGAAGRSRVAR